MHPENLDLKPFLEHLNMDNTVLVLNKSDIKFGKPEVADNYLGLTYLGKNSQDIKIVNISIKEEKNLDKLINAIKEKLKKKFISSEDIFITRQRHRINLENCIESLKNFEEKKTIDDFDKAAEDLRLATRYLGKIVGKVDVEEILETIFKDFCIGK